MSLRPDTRAPASEETRAAGNGAAHDVGAPERPSEPLGLYVHWPFCQSKCPYCDFNSHVSAEVDHARWREMLLVELETLAARTGARTGARPLTSIFFGGGTPSLMQPETAAALIQRTQQLFRFNNDIEITLEANPTSVESAKLEAFRAAGINRVSLGVQALNDADLGFLGRRHTAAEALAAVAIARSHFDNVSFDLIYARPGQEPSAWEAELNRALAEGLHHLSLYQLTIEPTTPFYARHARGEFVLPDDAGGAALYETTQRVLEAAGLAAYEVSNHARPGFACRHNLLYWRYGDYIGIGPGAHGRISSGAAGSVKSATRTHRAPSVWLDRVARDGHALVDDRPLPRDEMLVEATLMGLRTTDGLTADRTSRLFGTAPDALFDPAVVDLLVDGGFLAADAEGLRATYEGRTRLDAVTARLLEQNLA